jgi:MoaA/NifB/PqqE/SkfB family radical SAM enzyme
MRVEFSSVPKVYRWADRVIEYRDTGRTRPVHMGLHITNRCTHACPACNGGRGEGELTAAQAISVATQARDLGVKAITFGGGGDPLAHPDAAVILDAVTRMGMAVGVITNGAILDGTLARILCEQCAWVRVSLDAGTPERYAEVHGKSADFATTLLNLRMLGTWAGRKATLGVSYLTDASAWEDLEPATVIAKNHGADYIIFRPFDGDTFDCSNLIDLAADYLSDDQFQVVRHYERIQNPERSYTRCHAMRFVIEVSPEGFVYPCCHWKNRGVFAYGNIHDDALAYILESREFEDACGMRVQAVCPKSCRNHPLNEEIERKFLTPVMHEAFI